MIVLMLFSWLEKRGQARLVALDPFRSNGNESEAQATYFTKNLSLTFYLLQARDMIADM